MKTINFLLCLCLVSFISCKTAEIQLDPSLQSNTKVMPVKGKQKFKFKKTLYFGDYVVTENRNSWPWVQKTNFFLSKTKGKQKMQFDISNAEKDSFSFFGISELKVISSKRLQRIHPWLPEIDLSVNDLFEGSIQTPSGIWELVVCNVNAPDRGKSLGFLHKDGITYYLEDIRQLDHFHNPIPTDRYGFALKKKNEVIGTVRTFSNGKVWIKEELDKETQLLMATVSAALLLQQPMRKS